MKNKQGHLSVSATLLGAAAIALCLSGCASNAPKSQYHDPRDPWEGWNRGVQKFNDALDDYVMKPVSKGYQYVTPGFVDRGVTNFFSNVDDLSVTVNDLLQGKFAQGGADAGRFLINTVAGLGGFLDVASMLDLQKHDEDFDQTLGSWGVPSGPYLVLPFLGPSTPRGAFGFVGDTATNPINYINPAAIPYGSGTLNLVDVRADSLSDTKIADEASVDRYEFYRNAYFQRREYLINDGEVPLDEGILDEDLELDKTPKK